MTSYRKVHPRIRDACRDAGWKIRSTYNDLRATSRRLSYCRNGWPVPAKMKTVILRKVNIILKDEGIDARAVWYKAIPLGYISRGPYDKLTIQVPK